MSALHGDVPSLPRSAQLRQHYFAVITAHADDPVINACVICKQTKCHDWRYAYEVPQPDPWRGLLNSDGGETS
ncbi:MAG TPA: hypothetical protein VEO01_12675 [Pseudonocardiaceae bacterium]|nr:hypothetical protein [Pseudonocardiaceae bacterium]